MQQVLEESTEIERLNNRLILLKIQTIQIQERTFELSALHSFTSWDVQYQNVVCCINYIPPVNNSLHVLSPALPNLAHFSHFRWFVLTVVYVPFKVIIIVLCSLWTINFSICTAIIHLLYYLSILLLRDHGFVLFVWLLFPLRHTFCYYIIYVRARKGNLEICKILPLKD